MAIAKKTSERSATKEKKNVPVRKPLKAGALSIRVDDATCRFIDRGAEIAGQSRSEFMIQAARERAEEILLNQRLFVLTAPEWDAFNAAIDDPPASNAALKELMSSPAPWRE